MACMEFPNLTWKMNGSGLKVLGTNLALGDDLFQPDFHFVTPRR